MSLNLFEYKTLTSVRMQLDIDLPYYMHCVVATQSLLATCGLAKLVAGMNTNRMFIDHKF